MLLALGTLWSLVISGAIWDISPGEKAFSFRRNVVSVSVKRSIHATWQNACQTRWGHEAKRWYIDRSPNKQKAYRGQTVPFEELLCTVGAVKHVHSDLRAPAMSVCGRHLSCGYSESQGPDGPFRSCLYRYRGPAVAALPVCLSGRAAPWKVWFCGSFERTTGQGQQRHL